MTQPHSRHTATSTGTTTTAVCPALPPSPFPQALPSIALLHLVEAAAASLRATVSPHGPYGGTAHGRGPYGRAGGVWPRVPRYVDPGAPLQVGLGAGGADGAGQSRVKRNRPQRRRALLSQFSSDYFCPG